MSAVYSTQFIAEQGLDGSYVVLPRAGYVMVVRDVDVYYSGTYGGTVRLLGDQDQTIWFHSFPPLDEGDYASWRGRQVIKDTLAWSVTTTDAMDVTVSGYLLTLP